MRCEDVDAHGADYLAGRLPPDVLTGLAEHLGTCASCRADLESLRALWQQLGVIPAPEPNSSRIRAGVMAAIEGETPRDRERTTAPTPRRGAWQVPSWLAVGAAAATLVMGVAIGRSFAPEPSPSADLTALREEVRDMRVMVGLSLMQQQSASARLKGVSWSSQIDQPGSELVNALLDTLMHDPNDNVRLATVDALKRFADRDVVRAGAAEALGRQTSPLVQIALIDFVVETNDRAAVETLKRLSNDPAVHELVRTRAAQAVERMG